jgi:hypothetical protein
MNRWCMVAAMMCVGWASMQAAGNSPPPHTPEAQRGSVLTLDGVAVHDDVRSLTTITIGRDALAQIQQQGGGQPGAAPGSAPGPKIGANLGTIISGLALAAAITVGGLALVKRGRRSSTALGAAVAVGILATASLADITPGRRPRPPEPDEQVIVRVVDGGGISITLSKDHAARLPR